jgi:hypothetical protein
MSLIESRSRPQSHSPSRTSFYPTYLLPTFVKPTTTLNTNSTTTTTNMCSTDIPPPHIPTHVPQMYALTLQITAFLWTLCYILLYLQFIRTQTYGMPLLSLSFNLAWEIVYPLLIAESALEKSVCVIWLLLDLCLIHSTLKYGKREWSHAPWMQRNLGWCVLGMVSWCVVGHWTFASWWINEREGAFRQGKFYRGVEGIDTTELGFWIVGVAQAYLSAASLIQLRVRGHSGGVGHGIWYVRSLKPPSRTAPR